MKVAMNRLITLKKSIVVGGLLTLFAVSTAQATTVQIQTNLGDIEINLFDKKTPITVQNFLSYVNSGAYNDTLIHRSVPGFVIQGGDYSYTGQVPPTEIEKGASILNEPFFSNVKGTIAMAKYDGYENSAVNSWFINLADNSESLDPNNGGYAVFGQVTAGLDVVEAIENIQTFNMLGAFTDIPLRNYTAQDVIDNTTPDEDNFVIVYAVNVLDGSEDTASGLTPVENKLINKKKDSGGGGSSGLILSILGLMSIFGRRKLN